jgi:hypothetical protein
MRYPIGATWLCLLLSACAGDGKDETAERDTPPTCNFRAELGGAESVKFTGNNDVRCYPASSYIKGLRAVFETPDVQVAVHVDVQDVVEGETGTDYRVRLEVDDQNGELPSLVWLGVDCVASVAEHQYLRTVVDKVNGDLREYRVSIDGSCPQPIPSLIPEVGPLTLDAFSFMLNFFWEQPIIPSM